MNTPKIIQDLTNPNLQQQNANAEAIRIQKAEARNERNEILENWCKHPITQGLLEKLLKLIEQNSIQAERLITADSRSPILVTKQLIENNTLRKIINYARTGTLE